MAGGAVAKLDASEPGAVQLLRRRKCAAITLCASGEESGTPCRGISSLNQGNDMNKLTLNALTLAVSLAFSAGAIAEGMSKVDYKAGKDKISAEYKTAKASCDSFSGNAKDVCKAEASGKEMVAGAELEASYHPDAKHRNDILIAKADADYGIAAEKCDDMAGNAKDVCVKEAKAAQTASKADAKAKMKAAEANAVANEKVVDARSDAGKKTVDARKDAAEDKSDAQYSVAKEKCDSFSGTAKDSCLSQAKARFGK